MPERILVVRSARDEVLGYACRLLAVRYPQAELAVLAQPEHADRVRALPGVAEVIAYAGDRFCPEQLPGELACRLRAAAFAEVVVLWHNRDGAGYAPVQAMVRLFQRGPVTVVDCAGGYQRLPGSMREMLAGLRLVWRALRAALARG
ncbi:MAG TPA: hypothetical protein PKM88_13290 [bacterium]|nr:hypothetical protein [bacterium]